MEYVNYLTEFTSLILRSLNSEKVLSVMDTNGNKNILLGGYLFNVGKQVRIKLKQSVTRNLVKGTLFVEFI